MALIRSYTEAQVLYLVGLLERERADALAGIAHSRKGLRVLYARLREIRSRKGKADLPSGAEVARG
jgi:hypothetical protein